MLPAKNRLTKDKDFKSVFQKGKSFFTQELGVKCASNNLEVTRFGFSVSLKISKKAVKRNLLKRRLREIIQKKLEKIKPGYDCVVVARSGILDLDYKELEGSMELILKKLKLFK